MGSNISHVISKVSSCPGMILDESIYAPFGIITDFHNSLKDRGDTYLVACSTLPIRLQEFWES